MFIVNIITVGIANSMTDYSQCKTSHFHRTFNSQGFTLAFNRLNFVKGLCGKVTFTRIRTTDDWNIFDWKFLADRIPNRQLL